MKLDKAQRIAQGMVADLMPYCERCLIAGSVRREAEDVKDIELVIQRRSSADSVIQLAMWIKSQGTIKKGDPISGRYVQVHHHAGIMVDIFLPQPHDFWRIFAIRTGPRAYSQMEIARGWNKKGWVGTADGLRLESQCERHGKAGVWKCGVKSPTLPPSWTSEEDFFAWLGIMWLKPSDRGLVADVEFPETSPHPTIQEKIELGMFTPRPDRSNGLTVGRLIRQLETYRDDMPVVIQVREDEKGWRAQSVEKMEDVELDSTGERLDIILIWGG